MNNHFQIAIVGAGFAGIVAALRLKAAGKNDFVILEKSNEIGGTWRDNTYPGCACDVPSNLYSIAHQPNPKWSEMYATQVEILDYLKQVVQKNDLQKHIRCNTEAFTCEFLAEKGHWKIADRLGKTVTARFIILGAGPLNRPKLPKIKGLTTFKGKIFHSAEWDSSYDLTGKKVAVIGTGASAIQIVPAIAPIIGQMTVFQRSGAWIDTRNNRHVSNIEKSLFSVFPFLQKTVREILYWAVELRGSLFVGNKMAHTYLKKRCLKKLEKEVKDPEMRKKLTPNYELGCKRVLTSDNYYPTFNQKNVQLVTESITEITENELITVDSKRHEVDVIILATGFSAAEILTDRQIKGLNQRELFSEWLATGMQAYKGTCVSGYPNLLFIIGPNTGLGHSSMIHIMESQMNYVMQYIAAVENAAVENAGENTYFDLKPEIQTAHNQHLQSLFKDTVWATEGCQSWYRNAQGLNTILYPRLTVQFRKDLKTFELNDFRLF